MRVNFLKNKCMSHKEGEVFLLHHNRYFPIAPFFILHAWKQISMCRLGYSYNILNHELSVLLNIK